MRSLLVVALTVAALSATTEARAASVTVEGRSLTYEGTVAEANAVSVSGTTDAITVTDPGKAIKATGPCSGNGTATVVCPGFIDQVRIDVDADAGVGADTAPDSIVSSLTGFPSSVAVPGLQEPITLLGGDGPLTIQGGAGAESLSALGTATLRGGGGDDVFTPRGPGSVALGEAGDDAILAVSTGTQIDGGPGADGVLVSPPEGRTATDPVTATVDATTTTTGNGFAGQNLRLTAVERLVGSDGPDTLTATGSADNVLVGLGGADTLDGGPGQDELFGDEDRTFLTTLVAGTNGDAPDRANTFRSADGATDVLHCTPAGSAVTADSFDLLRGCPAAGAGTTLVAPAPVIQQVPVPVPGPAAPRDTTQPAATRVSAPAPAGKALRRSGRYSVAFTPGEPVSARVELTARAGRLASIARAGDVVLATRTARAPARVRTTVRLTVARKLRRLLKAKRRLAVTITLTDAAGNASTVRRTVRIRG